MKTLVWLQRELRIQHHPALEAALAESDDIIVAYFHDPEQTIGDANTAWLANSLQQLQQDFKAHDGRLWCLEGNFEQQLDHMIQTYQIEQVFYTFQLGHPFKTMQQQALNVCQRYQVALRAFDTENWLPYDQLLNQSGRPYKVFTPFYNTLSQKLSELLPFSHAINSLEKTARTICQSGQDQTLPQSLTHLSTRPWARKVMQHWQTGERQAWEKFERFLNEGLAHYEQNRDFPAVEGTSQLSPHLHFGEIHSRAIVFELLTLETEPGIANQAIHVWLRQLAWREFARSILWHFPHTETHPFQAKFETFFRPLSEADPEQVKNYQAWCAGHTGVPIIDAGMKQLWETGWMHNRVRMLVASWLTKNADIDWRAGAHWFNNTLVDADPANNTLGWQWVAGCGVDAAPYYRLFNPVRQSEKFDAEGHYLRQWLPELTPYSSKQIHAPWQTTPNEKRVRPIIDLTESRQRHLEKVATLKSLNQIH
ncbi:Deoxyribodipyrimidine photo-lyase [Hydrogenovibrio crunogenus]|uniref:Deoxyribodipyrimidine photo-lyase n=1 Tax=Hydrogenovibrio crunogenus TaxID=39765 RepID=A0A4P7P2U1_9GAMM|nr:deoxyribodipyrimidine photo-lyase [Hydrogenovibrio crunogenus]QBZ84195.1 Deoxyribodipyrimidine photo-lyase [Hydrogenovibrio crunogenus]